MQTKDISGIGLVPDWSQKPQRLSLPTSNCAATPACTAARNTVWTPMQTGLWIAWTHQRPTTCRLASEAGSHSLFIFIRHTTPFVPWETAHLEWNTDPCGSYMISGLVKAGYHPSREALKPGYCRSHAVITCTPLVKELIWNASVFSLE